MNSLNNILPSLTAFDPEVKSEGSIDPLGLVPIADRLSVALVPGIRERMSHPRFVTLIAAGVAITQEFGAEVMAKDGVSNPLQVYEWYVVQALIKTQRENGLRGLPGIEKALTALKKDMPLNAARYLRMPSVFGFCGVYKTLMREAEVIQGFHLGEQGDRLVRVWEKEQGLDGYYTGVSGAGRNFRDKLKSAIEDSLKTSQVERNWNWSFFHELGAALHPNKPGLKERQVLFEILHHDKEQKRREIIDSLLDYANEFDVTREVSEYEFHRRLINKLRTELKDLILGIQVYEAFSRTLYNAFESLLFTLSKQGNRATFNSIKALPEIVYAAKHSPVQFVKAMDMLSKVKEHIAFENTFGVFGNSMGPAEFAEALVAHHIFIQKRKPPYGKLPWIERYMQDTLVLRPGYARTESLVNSDPNAYVYFYRTGSLISFLKDLKKING